jgi:type I restriction enzyme S subunit
MEVKPGYKQTEIGIIPQDWDVKNLGELVSLKTGPFGSSIHKSDYVSDGIPIINPTHIFGGELFPERNLTVSTDTVNRLAEFRLKTNDIIIGRRGEMGRCAVVREEHQGWLCGTGSLIIRSNSKIFPDFLQRVFSSPSVISKIEEASVGSTMVNLNQTVLFGLKIQYPPLPEQRAIAAALSDVDSLLSALDALLAKKRLIKQGTMQALLTGKTHLPGFIGEWSVMELNRIVTQFIVPMRDKPKAFKGEIPWCRIEDFDGKFLFDSKSNQTVDNETIKLMNLKVYPTGTLLVSCSADLGRCAIVGKPLVTNQTFIGLVFDDNKASSDFFYYYITFHAEELNNLSSGTTISYLSREQFESYKVKVPSKKAEQTAIAEILSDMDAEIAALEVRREKTRLLKQGMMQELLTGKTRLV